MNARILTLAVLVGMLAGCDPAEDVRVLPLPPLERPSPEARLGLPELRGIWRFAGWEVIRADTAALERTFPSFGDLHVETQRLDSIAGAFALQQGLTPVVGEVRRDGTVAMVTFLDGVPGSFVAGQFRSDTLWLELTSVLPADEWPRDARAAFVQQPSAEPFAWVRGARRPPTVEPMLPDTLSPPLEGVPGDPAFPGPADLPPGPPPQPVPATPPAPTPPPAPAPIPAPAPAPAPIPAPPPPPPPPPDVPDLPPLLGEPVDP